MAVCPSRIRRLTGVLLLLLLALARVAAAEEDAAAHYRKAETHYKLGEWVEAAGEYKETFRLKPVAGLLFNIAQAYRQAKDEKNAAFFYRQYLKLAPPDDANRELADQFATRCEEALRAKSPTPPPKPRRDPAPRPLRPEAPPKAAASDPPRLPPPAPPAPELELVPDGEGASCRIDGSAAPEAGPTGQVVATLTQGLHLVRCEREGAEPFEERATLGAGERWRVVVKLVPKPPPPAPPPMPGQPPPPPPAMRRADHPWGVRFGFGGLTGILGVGAEYQATCLDGLGCLAVALGTGRYPLTAGVSLGPGHGGWYADVHFAWSGPTLFGPPLARGIGVGATGGWDLRFRVLETLPTISAKAGLGLGWNTADPHRRDGLPLWFDLAVGPVF